MDKPAHSRGVVSMRAATDTIEPPTRESGVLSDDGRDHDDPPTPREQIYQAVVSGVSSPTEIAKALGFPAYFVGNHLQRLRELDMLESNEGSWRVKSSRCLLAETWIGVQPVKKILPCN